ncbi:MAG: DUF3143 domain-containing protein [Phormidesmis sp.]
MPPANTPLYSHPLPEIEAWLSEQGCDRDPDNISKWNLSQPDWSAELLLDVDAIVVGYTRPNGSQIQRVFKYSLSRSDLQKVIFSGP